MPLRPPIFLAFDEGSSTLDVVVWLIAGAIWMLAQISSARKKQEKRKQAQQSRPAAAPGGGESPSPGELAEIFRRLGSNIPDTPPPPGPRPVPPPPAPRPQSSPVSSSTPRRPAQKIQAGKSAAQVQPDLARRLARVRQEAEASARQAEEGRISRQITLDAIVPGVQSRAGEHRALDTATRHTGAILPRIYAMGVRLAPLPILPMPGLDRTHHAGKPLRTKLHSRREIRDSLIAQTFLQPAKGLST